MSDTLRDEIITSKTAARMLSRVTPIYDNSYVGLWIFEALGREYDRTWEIIETMPAQLTPETATWAIELWEQRYGIVPNAELTLEERRRRVILARSVPSPFCPASLQRYIKNLTGRESEVYDNVASYTFGVYITQSETMRETDFDTLLAYLRRQKPSHMSFELAMQSTETILIGVSTAYWKFPYPMTGTSEAGTQPAANILLAEHEGQLIVYADEKGYKIPYPLAGTLPEENTQGGVNLAAILASGAGEGYAAPYIPCGTQSAGTAT